jgi:hypothetical protein
MPVRGGFEPLPPEEVAGVERDSSTTGHGQAMTRTHSAAQLIDAGQAAATQARAAQLRNYTPGRFAARLLAPQVMLLILLALLAYLCFGSENSGPVHEKHLHLTVGPGCMAKPKTDKPAPAKYNAIDNITCSIDAPREQPHIGPIVTLCV